MQSVSYVNSESLQSTLGAFWMATSSTSTIVQATTIQTVSLNSIINITGQDNIRLCITLLYTKRSLMEFAVCNKQRSCCWANQSTGKRRCNCLLTYCEPTANRITQWTRCLTSSNCPLLHATWTYSSWNGPAYQGLT